MNSLSPVLIVVASAVLFHDRLTLGQAIGIGVSLAGVMVIISRLDLAVITNLAFNRGDIIIFLNQAVKFVWGAAPLSALGWMGGNVAASRR